MQKTMIARFLVGILMTVLWSIVFVKVLSSWAGIGIGICFGISYEIVFLLISKKKDK